MLLLLRRLALVEEKDRGQGYTYPWSAWYNLHEYMDTIGILALVSFPLYTSHPRLIVLGASHVK